MIPLAGCTVTIAIPVYNSEATLERAVRSALAQSLGAIEVLVGDDGSTDGSRAVAERLAVADDRIILVSVATNVGKARMMNMLAERARGAWLAVLDADDAYEPDRLRQLVDAAEALEVDMVADNLAYLDPGTGKIARTGFEPGTQPSVIGVAELLARTSSFASFDYGVLKPMVRTEFLRRNGLRYREGARLSEDFYYLLDCLVAGGRLRLVDEPLYVWTLPFSPSTRRWTTTGSGAWRYDYRNALQTNADVLAAMQARGEHAVVRMLRRRGRQYRVMAHYLHAQRLASEGAWMRSVAAILRSPSTYRLLAMRVAGRLGRLLAGNTA